MTKKILIPAALLLLAACGHKAETADSAVKKDGPASETITMEDGVPAASSEETLSVEAAAPSLVAPHGGILLPAGAAIVELVLSAKDQRIYLLDSQGNPAPLGDDCQKFAYLADSGEVADFKRTKDGYFVTTDLPGAAMNGTSGRIYFATCPIEGVTSALVQISPDPQRPAAGEAGQSCGDLSHALGTELETIRTCSDASDCGGDVPAFGSCGCTHNPAVRKDADTSRYLKLFEQMKTQQCPESGQLGTCECPPAEGYRCVKGRCEWNFTGRGARVRTR